MVSGLFVWSVRFVFRSVNAICIITRRIIASYQEDCFTVLSGLFLISFYHTSEMVWLEGRCFSRGGIVGSGFPYVWRARTAQDKFPLTHSTSFAIQPLAIPGEGKWQRYYYAHSIVDTPHLDTHSSPQEHISFMSHLTSISTTFLICMLLITSKCWIWSIFFIIVLQLGICKMLIKNRIYEVNMWIV